jgi:hypothetical protein
MARLVFVIGIVLLMCACHNPNGKRERIFRLTKDELVREIADENIVMGGAVGVAGTEPDQWIRFEALSEKANEQEIIALTDHTNNTVKCYAFMALIDRKSNAFFPVLLKKLSDTGTTHTMFGCLVGTYPLNEFCVNEAIMNNQVTEAQKQILDSTIFFQGDSNLISRFRILEELDRDLIYYRVARERVIQNPEYVVLLSKYGRPADREIISNFLKSNEHSIRYWGLRAVSHYPDKIFFAQLSELAKDNYATLVQEDESYLYALYEALVRYRNKASREIMEKIIEKSDGIDSLKKATLFTRL